MPGTWNFRKNWAEVDRRGRRGLVKMLVASALGLAILLPIAGSWTYLGGWLYTIWLVLYVVIYSIFLIGVNPELYNSRMKTFPKGTKPFDKWFWLTWRLSTLVMMILAALDVRYGWSSVPEWLVWTSFLLSLVFSALGMWPIMVNRHFETNVRIQTDRDHKVVDVGPYKIVRHPGYTFALPGFVLSAFMLESLWALIPASIIVAAFVTRTVLEDHTLQEELDGYREYAAKTRWRLFPGIW